MAAKRRRATSPTHKVLGKVWVVNEDDCGPYGRPDKAIEEKPAMLIYLTSRSKKPTYAYILEEYQGKINFIRHVVDNDCFVLKSEAVDKALEFLEYEFEEHKEALKEYDSIKKKIESLQNGLERAKRKVKK
jgi:hypothetical protein